MIICAFRVIYSTTERENKHTEGTAMNEKITKPIKKMKKQNIGVEVDMNCIKREKTAQTRIHSKQKRI